MSDLISWNNIPIDIKIIICALSVIDNENRSIFDVWKRTYRLSHVCRQLRFIVNSHEIWKHIYRILGFNISDILPENTMKNHLMIFRQEQNRYSHLESICGVYLTYSGTLIDKDDNVISEINNLRTPNYLLIEDKNHLFKIHYKRYGNVIYEIDACEIYQIFEICFGVIIFILDKSSQYYRYLIKRDGKRVKVIDIKIVDGTRLGYNIGYYGVYQGNSWHRFLLAFDEVSNEEKLTIDDGLPIQKGIIIHTSEVEVTASNNDVIHNKFSYYNNSDKITTIFNPVNNKIIYSDMVLFKQSIDEFVVVEDGTGKFLVDIHSGKVIPIKFDTICKDSNGSGYILY